MMNIHRKYINAPAAIKNRLIKRGQTMCEVLGLPGVLLKEVAPDKHLTSFGGFVAVQLHVDGRVRVIGAAGSWIGRFASYTHPGDMLQIPISCTPADYATKTTGATNYAVYRAPGLVTPGSPVISFDGTPDWSEARISDVLLLGWQCPARSGIIWEGKYAVQKPLTGVWHVEETRCVCAVTASIPLKISFANIDLPSHRAAFMAGVDSKVEKYVGRAFDQVMAGVISQVYSVDHPFAVNVSDGMVEVGMNYWQAAAVENHAYLTANAADGAGWTPLYLSSASSVNPPTVVAATSVCPPLAGAMVGGVLIPKFNPVVASVIRGVVRDALFPNGQTLMSFPLTASLMPLGPVLGPMFPAAYAGDSSYPASGDIDLSTITMAPTLLPPLKTPTVSQRASTGNLGDKGDATLVGTGLFYEGYSASYTYGGGIAPILHNIDTAIKARAESLARADWSLFS